MKDHTPQPFNTPLPWQTDTICHIQKQFLATQQPISLILHSPPGMGLWNMAEHLTYRNLCKQPTQKKPCGTCTNCRIIQQNIQYQQHNEYTENEIHHLNHPHIWTIQNTTQQIGVDLIRTLTEKLQIQTAQNTLIIIGLIEYMSNSTYNALLKTIEEPKTGQQFILLTHQIHRIPDTIKSRCPKFHLPPSYLQSTCDWLTAKIPQQNPTETLQKNSGKPLLCLHRKEWLEQWHQHLNQVFNQKITPLQHLNTWLQKNDITELIDTWIEKIYQFACQWHDSPKYHVLITQFDQFLKDIYLIKTAINQGHTKPKTALVHLMLQWSTIKTNSYHNTFAHHATDAIRLSR